MNHSSVRILDDENNRLFGPGPYRLLKGIQKHGSLRAAAMDMGLAYSKAFRIIKQTEAFAGAPLITREIGGKGGGGSRLSPLGEELIRRYTDLSRICDLRASAFLPSCKEEAAASQVGVVVMAAGRSERFGSDKLLADLAGLPVLARTLLAIPADRVARIAAVVSRDGEEALCHTLGVKTLRYPGGPVSESLRVGLTEMADLGGCLFLNGDQPLIRPESILAMLSAFQKSPECCFRLSFEGIPGNPVLFSKVCYPALRALDGENGGAAIFRRGVPCELIPAAGAEELWDMDTPEQLAAAEKLLCRSPAPLNRNILKLRKAN